MARISKPPEVRRQRRETLFARFGIDRFAEVKVADLSTGMKQKVSLVVSIVHDPSIIIFDEPTNGLDVLTARVVTDFLQELRRQGKTIIVSTHIFSLVEKLCDRVGIIIDGRMVCCDTLEGVRQGKSLEDRFFDICTMDYSRMKEAFKPLKALMERTDKVHIVGRGTDITFSIKGMPAIPCAGENNIPDGEIFTAPIRDSINGVITYNTTAFYEGVAFENICFRFENGRIVEATSSDTERLNQILDRDEGCRHIGEFAIGVNPYVTSPMKDSMFNEKMSGSIHFTPGNCIAECDNGNYAPIHWDIVYAQTPEYGGGEIYFDDVLIRKDGRFVPEELQGLNPENLK